MLLTLWSTLAALAHPTTQLVVDGGEVWYGDSSGARLIRIATDGAPHPVETGLEAGCCHALHLVGDEVWTGSETGGLVAVPREGGEVRPVPLPDHPDARSIGLGGNPWCVAADGAIWAAVGRHVGDRAAARIVRVHDGQVEEIADVGDQARNVHAGVFDCAGDGVWVAALTGVLHVTRAGSVTWAAGGPRGGDRDGRAARARFLTVTSLDAAGDEVWIADPGTGRVSVLRDARVRSVYTAPETAILVAAAAVPGGAVALIDHLQEVELVEIRDP